MGDINITMLNEVAKAGTIKDESLTQIHIKCSRDIGDKFKADGKSLGLSQLKYFTLLIMNQNWSEEEVVQVRIDLLEAELDMLKASQ